MGTTDAKDSANNLSVSFKLFAGVCALLFLVLMFLLILTMTGGGSAGKRAFDEGHRIRVMVKDGSIEGKIKKLAPEKVEDTASGDDIPSAATGLVGFDVGEPEPNQTTPPPTLATNPADLVGSVEETLDTIPLEPRTNASLAAAPYEKLIKKTAAGFLPKKGGGTSPFDYYRRPFSQPKGRKPIISIIVTDLGAIKAQTEAAMKLPPEVTLAFNPYARHTPVWLESARNKGHEAWLMLPAQPDDFPASDPGPDAMLLELKKEEELLPRLHRNMARVHGYAGFILPVAEKVSENLEFLKWLGKQLEDSGLGLIAAEKPSNSACAGWFVRESRTYSNNVLIDNNLAQAKMLEQLEKLEKIARQQGHAMGIIRAYPLSIRTLNEWIDSLKAKGIQLAPASAVAEK